jgi:hypothetical protein
MMVRKRGEKSSAVLLEKTLAPVASLIPSTLSE